MGRGRVRAGAGEVSRLSSLKVLKPIEMEERTETSRTVSTNFNILRLYSVRGESPVVIKSDWADYLSLCVLLC